MNSKGASSEDSKKQKSKGRRGSTHVYEVLRDDILWLRLEPGSAIDEVALSERFNISRTPIREALLLLSGDYLVKFLPNRTTIVAPLSLDNAGAFFDTYLVLSRAVVRSAALNFQSEHQPDLTKHLEKLQGVFVIGQAEQALRVELEIKKVISEIAENEFQQLFYDKILDFGIRTKILHYFRNAKAEEIQMVRDQWSDLVEAIQHNQAELADEITTKMISAEAEIVLRSVTLNLANQLQFSSIIIKGGQ